MSESVFDFFKSLVERNSVDTLEFWDDMLEMREIKQMISEHNDFSKMLFNMFNSFALNNGLINRINFDLLNDEEKTFLTLITNKQYTPKNRYRQHILKYYFDNINEDMKNLSLEKLGFMHNYYNIIPPLYKGISKINNIVNPIIPEDMSVLKNVDEYIKIGKSIQFDVEGFPQNQLLYLIAGMCIIDCINTEHKTFKELVNHIKAYNQLNILNKSFDGEIFDEGYNLVTFIDFKNDGRITHNFRYQAANKYRLTDDLNHNTKLVDDDKGKYIKTELKKEELKSLWEKMELLYKNKEYDKLINVFFDSQCLTRSTCLTGVMLIMIFNKKTIKFKKDEMPDWKSIIEGTYEGTFDFVEDITIKQNEPFKLSYILKILRTYTKIYGQ